MNVWVAWDIDGTLLTTEGGPGHPGIDLAAIAHASGCPEPRPLGSIAGKTDLQILEELVGAAYLDAALTAFHEHWPAVFDPSAFQPLPGVHAVLDELPALGVGSSLVTGNVRGRALAKVAAIEIDHHFAVEVSAFGDESTVRADLVQAAMARSGDVPVVIVGDTTRDIAAARAGGAWVVAVATGPEPADDLAAAQPDLLLEDLVSGAAALLEFVTAVRSSG